MGKVRITWGYPVNVDIDTEKKVDVYIDGFPGEASGNDVIRIIILQEPFLYKLFDLVRDRPDSYTYVLTYFDDILRTNPKAKFLMATTSWVMGYVPAQKTFSVSTVVGGKVDKRMSGYELRHDIWRNRDKITIPNRFYMSGELPWREVSMKNELVLEGSIVPLSKAPLFDSQFHIAIENMSIKNMFTEKIIDCFQTKTVPIYYGCTNIGDFFNLDGIIVVSDLEQVICACNKLTSETYESMMPAIADNYNRSHKYCVYDEQIKRAILELI